MSNIKHTYASSRMPVPSKQKKFSEIVKFLNTKWISTYDALSQERMKALDKALRNPSKTVPTIFVAGTNGKSLTTHFATKLLKEEGLTVATFCTPHVISYQEYIQLHGENVSQKTFADIANEVLLSAETHKIDVSTQEILLGMALLTAHQNNVDVLIIELDKGATSHPAAFIMPKIVALTRITSHEVDADGFAHKEVLKEYMGVIKKDIHFICADQNKTNLNHLLLATKEVGGHWELPIRKLAPLMYPFEQLHGRCAALAERIAAIFINKFADPTHLITESLLLKKKAQRGRPTLETKRNLELHPKKTIEHFWKETASTLTGRFQIFEKEKPMIILDNPTNVDAYENFLLGVRLMHYQKSLKGLALIVGGYQNPEEYERFLHQTRYFFKKTPGQIFLCPVTSENGIAETSWDIDKVAHDLRTLKVKAKSYSSFKEALENAKKAVSDRNGLVAIGGPASLLVEYWSTKGLLKS